MFSMSRFTRVFITFCESLLCRRSLIFFELFLFLLDARGTSYPTFLNVYILLFEFGALLSVFGYEGRREAPYLKGYTGCMLCHYRSFKDYNSFRRLSQ